MSDLTVKQRGEEEKYVNLTPETDEDVLSALWNVLDSVPVTRITPRQSINAIQSSIQELDQYDTDTEHAVYVTDYSSLNSKQRRVLLYYLRGRFEHDGCPLVFFNGVTPVTKPSYDMKDLGDDEAVI
jgi:hypothetical protein